MLQSSITLSTQCYDKDYLSVLNEERLKKITKITGHLFDIIINTSKNYVEIKNLCRELRAKNLIKDFYCIDEHKKKILNHFNLKEESFTNKLHYNICLYGMGALYFCKTDYICFFTGDSTPLIMSNFIDDCIEHDKKASTPHTYMLSWAADSDGIKAESFNEDEKFYYTKLFSDQNFLINVGRFDFKTLLSSYQRGFFPHLDAFEARFHKYMVEKNISRCVYKHGLYKHQNY